MQYIEPRLLKRSEVKAPWQTFYIRSSFSVVNFTNILQASFLPMSFGQNLQTDTVRTEMLQKTL